MIPPLNWDMLQTLLTPRQTDSHKGDFGHVLVVGGDDGFGGAALLAATAAARCGAGLTSVATHPVHAPTLLVHRPELMVRGISEPAALQPLLERATVLVLGPGLGQSPWSLALFTHALNGARRRKLPIVMDADALNLLSQYRDTNLPTSYEKWLLTPHPGEAGRLLGTSTDHVQVNREQAVRQLHSHFGGAVILKGMGSLVCTGPVTRARVEYCKHGNPGMASGGMGDILSGVCGAMLAQGFDLATAARLAVCLHSKAADMAAAADGERGLLASDLLQPMRRLLNP